MTEIPETFDIKQLTKKLTSRGLVHRLREIAHVGGPCGLWEIAVIAEAGELESSMEVC